MTFESVTSIEETVPLVKVRLETVESEDTKLEIVLLVTFESVTSIEETVADVIVKFDIVASDKSAFDSAKLAIVAPLVTCNEAVDTAVFAKRVFKRRLIYSLTDKSTLGSVASEIYAKTYSSADSS